MTQQGVEALNRTFQELKSKNEETRLKASYELRELVATAVTGMCSALPLLRRVIHTGD